jgi:methylglutaconyl-CoA hydratase
MTAFTRLRFEDTRPAARVTLARPEVRNAFDETLIAELTEAFAAVAASFASSPDTAPRALVLAGDGPAFCAGADMNWMKRSAAFTREENEADAARFAAMLRAFDELPVPTVARVHGAALGGGMGLIACCDVVVAAETAEFGFTEVRLGIAPAVISAFVLPKIGAAAARRYFLTAEVFPAGVARAIGLVHEVVPADQLDAVVDRVLVAIAGNGPRAVGAAKRLIRECLSLGRDGAIENAVRAIAALRTSAEGQEGLGAFLEKRRPSWKG